MSNALTKADLVAAVSEEAGLKKVEAERALGAILDVIRDGLAEGRKITLVGFGSFDVAERAERLGTHPRTGERITIPASKSVRFRPGKDLRESING